MNLRYEKVRLSALGVVAIHIRRNIQTSFVLFVFFFSYLFNVPSSQALEDFVCPEEFDCPVDLMPEVAFWTRIYGEFSSNQTLFYDSEYRVVYSAIECEGTCDGKSVTLNERSRLVRLLDNLAYNKIQGSTEYTAEELTILHATQQIKGFTLADASNRLKYRSGLKDKFYEGFPNYKLYRSSIVAILKKNNLPEPLQFLPFVESTYNPLAVSPAKAVGLWQLMITAAKDNGLKVDSTVDERRLPIDSTEAAAKYLVNSYTTLDNSACSAGYDLQNEELGPFVLTSYIYGIGIKNAFKSVGSDYMDVRCNYKGKSFGSSSKNYYAKFLAAGHVATHEDEYFGEIVPTKELIETKSLKLFKSLSAPAFATKINFEIEKLKFLNLKYTENVWRGKLYLPANDIVLLPWDVGSKEQLATYGEIVSVSRTATSSTDMIPLRKAEPIKIAIKEPAIKLLPTHITTPEKLEEKPNFFTNLFINLFSK